MACRTMQVRFLKLGTVLTYAFKVHVNWYNSIHMIMIYNLVYNTVRPRKKETHKSS